MRVSRGIAGMGAVVAMTIAAMAVASQARAQDDTYDAAEFTISVAVHLENLTDAVTGVHVDCSLQSSLIAFNETTGDSTVGFGSLFLYRGDNGPTPAANSATDFQQMLETDGVFDSVVEVGVHRYGDAPLEAWTNGVCLLEIYHGDFNATDAQGGPMSGLPKDCEVEPDANGPVLDSAYFASCVWPLTEPAAAEVSFERPNLPLGQGPSARGD